MEWVTLTYLSPLYYRIIDLNTFPANVPIFYQKTFSFLVFSGYKKWKHWPGMDQ